MNLGDSLSGDFFECEVGNIGPILGVLYCDCADMALGIQVYNSVFVEIPRFNDNTGTELNVKSVLPG